jgi:hypothetical protein
VDGPVCLPSVGSSGYRAHGRSRPAPCDANQPRERPRGGPTGNRFVVESVNPRPSPRRPACSAPCSEHVDLANELLWACDRLPMSATHDRRAGTPASRESSSARGSSPPSALGARLAPARALSRFRGKSPSPRFPRSDVSVEHEFCAVARRRAVASHRPAPRRAHARAFEPAREMTPRSHAVCRPSPRTPCGGVASFEARTVRQVARRLGEGGSPGNCFSEQHGPSIAERRARGRFERALARSRWFRAPLLDTRLEHPSVVAAPWWIGLETGPTGCVDQGRLRFRRPAKGTGCRAARVLGSLRKYETGDGLLRLPVRPICGHAARVNGPCNPTDQRL